MSGAGREDWEITRRKGKKRSRVGRGRRGSACTEGSSMLCEKRGGERGGGRRRRGCMVVGVPLWRTEQEGDDRGDGSCNTAGKRGEVCRRAENNSGPHWDPLSARRYGVPSRPYHRGRGTVTGTGAGTVTGIGTGTGTRVGYTIGRVSSSSYNRYRNS